MEALVLLGGFAAVAAAGYFIMAKIDCFLERVRRQNAERENMLPLHVATSCLHAIPSAAEILNDMGARYPNVQCSLSFGQEREVIRAFDAGDADVAIVSAQAESGLPARWECVTVNPRSVFMAYSGLPVKTLDQTPRHEKILWKHQAAPFLTAEFVQRFCGHGP